MSKHTPGIWIADTANAWPTQVGCCPLTGNPYSVSVGWRNIAAATTKEDAMLIAAAPELLDALLAVRTQWLQRGVFMNPAHPDRMTLDQADAAISKATGAA